MMDDWQEKHDAMMKRQHEMLVKMKIDSFNKDIGLNEPYMVVVKQNEKKLMKLFIDYKKKEELYESEYDEWRAYGRGHKSGGLLRSERVAYRNFINYLEELLKPYYNGDKYQHDWSITESVIRYLGAKAHKTGQFKKEYYEGVI